MSKSLLDVVCGPAMAVNMMSDLVNENIIEIQGANRVTVVVAEFERMRAEKDAFAPIHAVAAKRTPPRPLLLTGTAEKKNSTKSRKVCRRHLLKTLIDLGAFRRGG